MRNPKKVKVILFGLKKFDEYNYFSDTQAFIERVKPPDFPLNQIGQSQGILLSRLENYVQIKTNYLNKGIEGKFMFSFYNHNTKTFYDMNTLLKDGSNFIFLNLEFCDDQKPLLVRLVFIINREILNQLQIDLVKNKEKLSYLNQKILELYKKLQFESQLLNQINEEINIIKDQDQYQKEKYDIAILYSHPVVDQDPEEEDKYFPVNFNEDISLFLNLIKELNIKISYYITQATKQNLYKVLRQNPKIIYISCHGNLDDNMETCLEYEKELKELKELELKDDRYCCIEQVTETDISNILNQQLLKRALVFLSCCHSGNIAEIFHQQGYPTVGIDKRLKLGEKAANSYFQSFYEKLLQTQQDLQLKECHDQAKKQVQQDLGKKDFQYCESHKHTQKCKKLFETEQSNQLIAFQQQRSCCQPQEDILQHKLDDQCQVKKKIQEFLKKQFQDQTNAFLERLDKVAKQNKGLLKICCCELAEIFFFQDDEFKNDFNYSQIEMEHRSSETFKLFGNENELIFSFIKKGDQTPKNKVQWLKEYLVQIEESKQILTQLLDIFQEKEKSKIIYVQISDNKQTVNDQILNFLKQVAIYFRQRYIEQSQLKDIRIEIIDNINQISKNEEQVQYIFIIKGINQKQWEQSKEFFINQKHIVIIPYIELKPNPPNRIYLMYDEFIKIYEENIKKNPN
ncbi:unnamed protein product [Paramecium primaurelia]|uniref:CHAT domain-containing protein n=1 Tax=Paramecium primaurelia TaxID=5886 RepID=A0A8S1QPW8_PARPR|nr:unnamed protein product [Paramecium primaurelia]